MNGLLAPALKLVAVGLLTFAVAWGAATQRISSVERDLARIEAKVDWIMQWMIGPAHPHSSFDLRPPQ